MRSLTYKQKEIAPENLERLIASLKAEGKSIATTNGSYDLMHAGHLHTLYEAAHQGDILIVALNTDASIQKYKSPKRPIVPLQYRLQMMAALGFVDYVTWFNETDPREILKKIRPNTHVIGAEYRGKCIEESLIKEWGGHIHFVEKVPGLSTTALIKKIIADGAQEP